MLGWERIGGLQGENWGSKSDIGDGKECRGEGENGWHSKELSGGKRGDKEGEGGWINSSIPWRWLLFFMNIETKKKEMFESEQLDVI